MFYEIDPVLPFYASAALTFSGLLICTMGFCRRVGFGHSIESAEEGRAKRLGFARSKSWGSGSTNNLTSPSGSSAVADFKKPKSRPTLSWSNSDLTTPTRSTVDWADLTDFDSPKCHNKMAQSPSNEDLADLTGFESPKSENKMSL